MGESTTNGAILCSFNNFIAISLILVSLSCSLSKNRHTKLVFSLLVLRIVEGLCCYLHVQEDKQGDLLRQSLSNLQNRKMLKP